MISNRVDDLLVDNLLEYHRHSLLKPGNDFQHTLWRHLGFKIGIHSTITLRENIRNILNVIF